MFVGGFAAIARGAEHEQVFEVGFGNRERLLDVLRGMTATVSASAPNVNF